MENRQPLHQAGKRSLKPIRREPLEIEAECLEKRRESQKEEHYNGPALAVQPVPYRESSNSGKSLDRGC